MRAKLELVALIIALALTVGCKTNVTSSSTNRAQPGSLVADLEPFNSLEEMRSSLVEPFGEQAELYVFQNADLRVAICKQLWGGVGSNALLIYGFDDRTRVWLPLAVWNTQARDVRVTFDQSTGAIKVFSGGGAIVFETNIRSLEVRKTPWGW